MTQVGFNKPANDVVQGNYLTEQLQIGATATAAKMLPGALVIKNTNDYGVGESGADGSVIGWLGYSKTNANYKPETIDTAYARGDYVAVHNGGNFRVRAIIVTEAVTKGAPLTPDTNGTVTAAANTDVNVVAHAAETVANTATTIWVISNI